MAETVLHLYLSPIFTDDIAGIMESIYLSALCTILSTCYKNVKTILNIYANSLILSHVYEICCRHRSRALDMINKQWRAHGLQRALQSVIQINEPSVLNEMLQLMNPRMLVFECVLIVVYSVIQFTYKPSK